MQKPARVGVRASVRPKGSVGSDGSAVDLPREAGTLGRLRASALSSGGLDGSAKGGVLFAMADRLGVPVRYIGIGEAAEDLPPFVAGEFVDALRHTGEAAA